VSIDLLIFVLLSLADYIKKKKTYYGYTVRYAYPKEKELLGENPLVIIV
jgi:hypothetical protein